MTLHSARIRAAAPRCAVFALVLLLAPNIAHAQPDDVDGEELWERGQALALRGQADASLVAYRGALAAARTSRDPALASAARLGMAEVFDVWRNCADSADVAYREAVQLADPGDFGAVDAYVAWLSRQGRVRDARALQRRAYEGLDVPRVIKRETISYLLGEATMQRASGNSTAALSSLTAARQVADRLATGEGTVALTDSVNQYSYWVLHDIAELRLDARSGAARNARAGSALRTMVDSARTRVEEDSEQRFRAGRLRDRVEQARRACAAGDCAVPPLPSAPAC